MPKLAKEMTALDVKRAKHSGTRDRNEWIAAGGVSGLLLQITPNNAKSWLLRTTIGTARRAVGLGPFPEIGLAEARDRARAAKAQIAGGVDPVEQRKETRAALMAAQRRGLTFAEALEKWIEAKGPQIGNEKAIAYLRSTFATYAAPEIGNLLVHEVTAQDLLRVLQPIWLEKTETGRKLRMRLEAVLSWAAVAGHRPHDQPNAARWKGNLAELLPKPDAITSTTHQPAVALPDLPGWWAALSKRGGAGSLALQFVALTACRSGEARGATWDEIDMDAGIWTVPGVRMKMGKEHRVALPRDALAILERQKKVRQEGSPFIFPAPRGGRLSDMTLSKVMRDMQAEAEKAAALAGEDPEKAGWRDKKSGRPAVPHGLRSTFRDWAAETGVDHVIAELALAHDVGSEVERAYRRTDMVERRRAVMERWADFLAGRTENTVVAFPAGVRA